MEAAEEAGSGPLKTWQPTTFFSFSPHQSERLLFLKFRAGPDLLLPVPVRPREGGHWLQSSLDGPVAGGPAQVAPPPNEPSNPNRRDLTAPRMMASWGASPTPTGGRALGSGWRPVDPQRHSCSWSSGHPASIPGLTPPFCGPEQLPQLDFLLQGGGLFPGRIQGLRAVSEKTGLWVNQGRIRALTGIFEMNRLPFSKMQSLASLWGTRAPSTAPDPGLYQDGCSPHTLRPVLPQGCLMFSPGQMHLDLTAVKASPLNPTSPDTPPGGPSPSTAPGRGCPAPRPTELQAQTFLPGLQLGSDSFL